MFQELFLEALPGIFMSGGCVVQFMPSEVFDQDVLDARIGGEIYRVRLAVFPLGAQGGLEGALEGNTLALAVAAVGIEVDDPVVFETVVVRSNAHGILAMMPPGSKSGIKKCNQSDSQKNNSNRRIKKKA